MADHITVEVVAGDSESQELVELVVPVGTTALEAVSLSGFEARHTVDPEALGIFGKKVAPNRVLTEFERVEIYRPLLVDPMTARRQRAEAAKTNQTPPNLGSE